MGVHQPNPPEVRPYDQIPGVLNPIEVLKRDERFPRQGVLAYSVLCNDHQGLNSWLVSLVRYNPSHCLDIRFINDDVAAHVGNQTEGLIVALPSIVDPHADPRLWQLASSLSFGLYRRTGKELPRSMWNVIQRTTDLNRLIDEPLAYGNFRVLVPQVAERNVGISSQYYPLVTNDNTRRVLRLIEDDPEKVKRFLEEYIRTEADIDFDGDVDMISELFDDYLGDFSDTLFGIV